MNTLEKNSKLILIVGGSRSGKSDFAQGLAESIHAKRYFIATCPAETGSDVEMAARIVNHQKKRSAQWLTIEEQVNLSGAIENLPLDATLLIDCLTLWISNIIFHQQRHGRSIDEDYITHASDNLLKVCNKRKGVCIFVSGEVGCGIVPENPLARLFRDLTGRCNQVTAAGVDEVFQVSCGIPVKIK